MKDIFSFLIIFLQLIIVLFFRYNYNKYIHKNERYRKLKNIINYKIYILIIIKKEFQYSNMLH